MLLGELSFEGLDLFTKLSFAGLLILLLLKPDLTVLMDALNLRVESGLLVSASDVIAGLELHCLEHLLLSEVALRDDVLEEFLLGLASESSLRVYKRTHSQKLLRKLHKLREQIAIAI